MARHRFLLFVLLALATPLQAGEKRALLIGINDYTKGPAHWDLRGCENDVAMTSDLLLTKFGFPKENVKVLLSAEATAKNIVDAIENWLIAPSKPDDIVYFHFSGHGSQAKDSDGDEDDGMDELICPSDMQLRDMNTVITDDQLGELFARIPSNNVTIILDACHSGTGTRDLSLSYPRFAEFDPDLQSADGQVGTRAVVLTPTSGTKPAGAAASSSAKPSAATAVGAAAMATSAGSATKPAATAQPSSGAPPQSKLAGSGGMESGSKLQVIISGCKSEQTSADALIRDGYFAGALSYNLIQNLKKAPPDISYRELMERVVRDVNSQNYTQIPQIEGDMDRPLFGTQISGAVSTPFLLVQSVQGDRVSLNAGRAQNVTKGSIYSVYAAGETAFAGSGVGRIKIVEVDQASASAQVLDNAPVRRDYRAKEILHNLDPDKLKLLLEVGAAPVLPAVQSGLASIDYVEIIEADKRFDHRLQIDGVAGNWQAALTLDGVPGTPVTGDDIPGLIEALKPLLENAYAIKYLAHLDNPNQPFGLRVWANHSGSGSGATQLNQAPDEKLVQARLGDVIRFNFQAERDCYLTLINVGTSGKITVLFPNKYRPDGFINGGRVYQTETKGQMPFKIRARGPAGRELVKIIATLDPLNLSSLTMGQAGGKGTRSIESSSSFVQQLTRDLAVEGLDEQLSGGVDVSLLPTDRWATDYLIIETTP